MLGVQFVRNPADQPRHTFSGFVGTDLELLRSYIRKDRLVIPYTVFTGDYDQFRSGQTPQEYRSSASVAQQWFVYDGEKAWVDVFNRVADLPPNTADRFGMPVPLGPGHFHVIGIDYDESRGRIAGMLQAGGTPSDIDLMVSESAIGTISPFVWIAMKDIFPNDE